MTASSQTLLSEILKKQKKTEEEAYLIYEKIRRLKFFESFFAENMRTLSLNDVLSLCRGFQYEHVKQGRYVFKKGDVSNNKFYIIISGQIGIIIPNVEKPTHQRNHSAAVMNTPKSRQNVNKTNTLLNKQVYSNEPMEVLHFRRVGIMRNLPQDAAGRRGSEIIGSSKRGNGGSDGKTAIDSLRDELVFHDNETEEEAERKIRGVGKFVRYLEEGDCFGELALKNNMPRSASIFCKTDCELLIMTKKQFDQVLLRKEHEKEDFLRDMFPYLANGFASTFNYNTFFYSFKSEVYNKGQYIIQEGKIVDGKGKISILFTGECLIEKTLRLEVAKPFEKTSTTTSEIHNIGIAKIGTGVIFGEEVLIPGQENEYEYSVKAVSDMVIIYRITKKDFKDICFKDLHNFMVRMFKIKKAQRDEILNNVRRDLEQKAEQVKAEQYTSHLSFAIKKPPITNCVRKASENSFTRKMFREQMQVSSKALEVPLSESNPTLSTPTITQINLKKRELFEDIRSIKKLKRYQKLAAKSVGMTGQKDTAELKFELLSRIPDIMKPVEDLPAPRAIQMTKFFPKTKIEEMKRYRQFNWKPTDLPFASQIPPSTAVTRSRETHIPIKSFLKDLAKSIKREKFHDKEFVGIRENLLNENNMDTQESVVIPHFNSVENIRKSPSRKISASHSPVDTPKTTMAHKGPLFAGFFSQVQSANTSMIIKPEPILDSKVNSPMSRNNSLRDFRALSRPASSFFFQRFHDLNKTDDQVDPSRGTLDHSEERDPAIIGNSVLHSNNSQFRLHMNFTPHESSPQRTSSESPNNSRIHGEITRHTSHVQKTRIWREKVFKKTKSRSAIMKITGDSAIFAIMKNPKN